MLKETFFIQKPVATGKTVNVAFDNGDHIHTFPLYQCGDLLLKWSGDKAPPQIGQEITITMNGIGPAIVKGYFVSEDYLGVMTYATNPPEWLKKQRERDRKDPRHASKPQWWKDGIGCEFGTEIEY